MVFSQSWSWDLKSLLSWLPCVVLAPFSPEFFGDGCSVGAGSAAQRHAQHDFSLVLIPTVFLFESLYSGLAVF